jgi:hypothetical protein
MTMNATQVAAMLPEEYWSGLTGKLHKLFAIQLQQTVSSTHFTVHTHFDLQHCGIAL